MRSLTSILNGGMRRGALALAAVLLATAAPAETLRVTAANSVGNLIYDVTSFVPPGAISPLNTDGASRGSFSSVVLTPNLKTGTVDVLAADFTKGQIIRYTPALGDHRGQRDARVELQRQRPDQSGRAVAGCRRESLHRELEAAADLGTAGQLDFDHRFRRCAVADPGDVSGGQGVLQLQETVVAASPGSAWAPGDVLAAGGQQELDFQPEHQ